nr:TPA_asm: movement protein [Thymus ophiovirus]
MRESSSSSLRMSAKQVKDEILKLSDTTVVSLSQDGDLPEGIEDIVADFGNIQKGIITSVIAPITVSLKKTEHNKKLQLTTLDKIKRFIPDLKKKKYPFIRFEKVQVLYLPLLGSDKKNFENETLSVSLIDHGKEKAGYDGLIQKRDIRLDQMALAELSMNYFVEKKDVAEISIEICASVAPVVGRAYGSLFVAFFVHEEMIPFSYEPKPSTLIYIDGGKAPKDLNKRSVLSNVSEIVADEVKRKREEQLKSVREGKRDGKKKMKNVIMETESRKSFSSSSTDSKETFIEAGRKSVDMLGRYLNEMNISDSKAENSQLATPKTKAMKNVYKQYKHPLLSTMLDTGSGEHFYYRPKINPTTDIEGFGGVDKMDIEEGAMFFSLGDDLILFSEVSFFSDLRFGCNILSFSKLRGDKIVDAMVSSGDEVFLMKDDVIKMRFDASNEGRMWLKDESYAACEEHGGCSVIEHAVRNAQSLDKALDV